MSHYDVPPGVWLLMSLVGTVLTLLMIIAR